MDPATDRTPHCSSLAPLTSPIKSTRDLPNCPPPPPTTPATQLAPTPTHLPYQAPPKPRIPAQPKSNPTQRQLVPLNLITSAPTNQLIPTSGPHLSMAIPVHNPAEPIALYEQELQTYLSYSIPGSTIFWAEGLPLDASPHEFSEILMQLENELRIPMDHAASLQHIQRQL